MVQKCTYLHLSFLHKDGTKVLYKDVDLTKEPTVWEKMNSNLEAIVERNIVSQSDSSATSSEKTFENRLTPIFNKLIFTASAPNSDKIPSGPTMSAREFFEQKNASETKSHIYH